MKHCLTKEKIMKTYKILNHLGDTQKTIKAKSIEEVEDAIYDLRNYHGFMNKYTYVEVK